VICGFYDVEIMLDDDHCVAILDQFIQHGEKFIDVLKMQACCRFVQDIECASCGAFGEFFGEFDALRFAA